MTRVLFLYNHDAAHQAAHVAGIMEQLALRNHGITVIGATGTPVIEAQLRKLVSPPAADRIKWVDLSLPASTSALLALPDRIAPVRRLARLRQNRELFASVDLVVSPERTCLTVRRALRKTMGNAAPPFVFVPHGAGDRSVTYHPELAQFDHYLVSGQKVMDEMVAHGIATPDQCQVTGYAKFDALPDAPPDLPFGNDLPVVVYNPHFDPHLSSWYDHGPEILQRLSAMGDRFNTVFAPHVMLFRKKLHISPEYRVARVRPEIPGVARTSPNLLIDVDSPRLFDMTYTRGADIYLGDVSSQVYEFLRDPGACVFLDAVGQGGDAYQFWQNGPVVRNAGEAIDLLGDWQEIGRTYATRQRELFAYTMDVDPDRSASERGADALEAILKTGKR